MIILKTDNRNWLYVLGTRFEFWPHSGLPEWNCSILYCSPLCRRREWRELRHNRETLSPIVLHDRENKLDLMKTWPGKLWDLCVLVRLPKLHWAGSTIECPLIKIVSKNNPQCNISNALSIVTNSLTWGPGIIQDFNPQTEGPSEYKWKWNDYGNIGLCLHPYIYEIFIPC